MTLTSDEDADLVALICWLARERGTALTTVQLVKYLYLADLYHARRHAGQTLTGWPWAFVHFGPYCTEAMGAIDLAADRGLIARSAYESRYEDKEFFLHRPLVREEPPIAETIPFLVRSGLKIALTKWVDDTAGLLDYVYFDTEPMKDIQPGASLDFSHATVPVAIVAALPPKKLSVRKEREVEGILSRLSARTFGQAPTTPLDTGPHDGAYQDAMLSDEEGGVEAGFRSTVSIADLDAGEVEE
jgi:hypothetical protein